MSEHIVDTFGIVQDFADLHGDMNTPLYHAIMDVMVSRQREEIVRCRDCKWFTPECEYQEEREYGVFETMVEPPDCGNPERCSHHYDSALKKMVPVHIVTQPDGYCAWGERRSE